MTPTGLKAPGAPTGEAARVRIGRQGIYDADGRVVAHELLFRGTSATAADLAFPEYEPETVKRSPDAQDQATSQVIAATFGDFGVEQLGDGKPLYLNLTRPFLVGDYPLPFGPVGVVLEILEHVPVDDRLLAGLQRLREKGFALAADDFVGELGRWALLPLMDVVKVDLLTLTRPLDDLVAAILEAAPDVTLLAERVEDGDALRRCRDAGFTLFQGYCFQRPALLETPRMSPSQLVCVRLLRALSDPDSGLDDLEQIVAVDPGLSLRVLRTANSAGVGSNRQISSLRQAVVMLGPTALSAWVMLTLMGGLGAGRREDLVLVLSRAAACEHLAADVPGVDGSVAYTAGLLSGVASVLGTDVGQVAAGAGVDEEMTVAVVAGNGPLGSLVRAVECYEAEDDAGVASSGIAPFDVSRAYLAALGLAMSTVEGVLGREE